MSVPESYRPVVARLPEALEAEAEAIQEAEAQLRKAALDAQTKAEADAEARRVKDNAESEANAEADRQRLARES